MPDAASGNGGTVWTEGHFVGGHVALDLCNTVYRRLPDLGSDLLDSPGTFQNWLMRVTLLSESADSVDDASLEAARGLRLSLWQAFDAHINREFLTSNVLPDILRTAERGSEYVSVGPNGVVVASAPSGALAGLAIAALQLLLTSSDTVVRACDSCGWYYVDTSRSGRRRWCSMKTCGNRNKVSRFRAASIETAVVAGSDDAGFGPAS